MQFSSLADPLRLEFMAERFAAETVVPVKIHETKGITKPR
jgi:hypothetical protein